MHNAAAADLGLDLVYMPLPVRPENLPAAIQGLAALGFRGANVTVPHKEKVIPLLDGIDAAAQAIGAVNTIVIGGKREEGSGKMLISNPHSPVPSPHLTGYNTDYSGFMADLETLGINVAGRDCWILGAGGSARAVAYGLASAGGRVHVFGRRPDQARQLAAEIGPHLTDGQIRGHPWSSLKEMSQRDASSQAINLIVNSTPLGMTPNVDASPWPEGLSFPGNSFVYDLIYSPAETRLMRQARAAGCRTANGLGMLVRQGAQAFQLWTGLEPDIRIMADAVMQDL